MMFPINMAFLLSTSLATPLALAGILPKRMSYFGLALLAFHLFNMYPFMKRQILALLFTNMHTVFLWLQTLLWGISMCSSFGWDVRCLLVVGGMSAYFLETLVDAQPSSLRRGKASRLIVTTSFLNWFVWWLLLSFGKIPDIKERIVTLPIVGCKVHNLTFAASHLTTMMIFYAAHIWRYLRDPSLLADVMACVRMEHM